MLYNEIDKAIGKSLRKQLTTALLVIAILVGGVGSVAAITEIGGAIIGAGKIIVEGRAKQVQHRDGGIVGEILVQEGQKIEAGQLLFRLDPTVVRASLAIVDGQLRQLLAQEARLIAEQAHRTDILFPDELLDPNDENSLVLVEGQKQLMATRQVTIDGRRSQLTEQVKQYGEKVAALNAEKAAIEENISFLNEQIAAFQHLHNRGLIKDSDLLVLKREHSTLLGSRASLMSQIVEAHQAMSEREMQKVQILDEFAEKVLTELDIKRSDISKLQEERIAARDKMQRIEIHAPISGYVHELNVHTIGGVVSPGETLVTIIPNDDNLIVEAKLAPKDVDEVHIGQKARLRLTSMDQRVTPQIYAHLIDVSPDLLTERQTGVSYYLARLRIEPDELAKIGDEELRPGMPVEVFIQTRMRTIFSYLTKPIVDQIQHAMRET